MDLGGIRFRFRRNCRSHTGIIFLGMLFFVPDLGYNESTDLRRYI
jgi:hypothetical protein